MELPLGDEQRAHGLRPGSAPIRMARGRLGFVQCRGRDRCVDQRIGRQHDLQAAAGAGACGVRRRFR
jgi:hypothetical protein